MNFSDFTKQKMKEDKKEEKKKLTEEDARRTYEELKDLNNDELTNRLYEEVRKQKADGSFNYDMLSDSVESIRGFLDPGTYENIRKLLETLR